MPVNTPAIKVNNVKRLGGQVELVGESYQETQAYAQVRREHGTAAAAAHCAHHFG
jgi:threonine dehydratase